MYHDLVEKAFKALHSDDSNDNIDVHITYNSKTPGWLASNKCHKVDFTNEKDVRACIELCKPDVVIHLAALSSPVACEKDPDTAMLINRPLLFLDEVKRRNPNVLFIFTSTDLVYDGEHAPYEVGVSEPPSPFTAYGKTKAAFERDVGTLENSIVLRLSNMIGPTFLYQKVGVKFLEWLTDVLATREYVGLLHDQIR